MQINDYANRVKKGFGTTVSQGKFMREVFKASGYDRFPSSSDEEYAKKICNGSKPITDDMIEAFPKPYRIDELATYYKKHISQVKVSECARGFGIEENHPDLDKLCTALSGQFFFFVDAGGGKNEVADNVASSYRKLLDGAKSEDILSLPYHSGDRAWIANGQKVRHYTKGFYEKFEHIWLIRNDGSVPWKNRKLICQSQDSQSIKINAYCFDIPETHPGETAEIRMQIDPRGKEGSYESSWEMVDSADHNCFPNERWLFNFTVTVINQSRVSTEVML